MPDRKLCVAPMMDWTDRHCRFLHRLLAPHALLYSEMVTTGALLHGDQGRHLDFSAAERPVALQLGGSEPDALAKCAAWAEKWDYAEVNLNVGCPSDRVQSGRFGACLMLEPATVADCYQAMQAATSLPVTIKCRIGVDKQAADQTLPAFIEAVASKGCRTFIIHARKAWLAGLSPKENRDIPPLDYALVYAMKQRYPELEIILNGGITSTEETKTHLDHVDGIMLGRAAYQNPLLLAQLEDLIYATALPDLTATLLTYQNYAREQREQGVPLSRLIAPCLGLFQGIPGARQFRRTLSEHHKYTANKNDINIFSDALAALQPMPQPTSSPACSDLQ